MVQRTNTHYGLFSVEPWFILRFGLFLTTWSPVFFFFFFISVLGIDSLSFTNWHLNPNDSQPTDYAPLSVTCPIS